MELHKMDTNARHANFYKALEEMFRGSRDTVRARLEAYTPFLEAMLKTSANPRALDLGCGRGEWLELLTEKGFSPLGVDLDEPMLTACRERGFDVLHADAIEVLSSQADSSLTIVSGFHIAEHLPFERLQTLVAEALRALIPGGLLILETPNPENLRVSTHTFHIDPTHTKPLPPSLLKFMTEFYGFGRSKILRLQEATEITSTSIVTIEDVYSGVSPDYAIVAQKAGPTELTSHADQAFSVDRGITSEAIFGRFQRTIEALRPVDSDGLSETLQEMLSKQNDAIIDLEREIDALKNSASWRLAAPMRLAARKAKWVWAGLHAWATLRPGSRPYRYLRKFAMIARRFVLGSPFLYSLSRRLLKPFPGIQRRLRNLLMPPELRNLVSSAVPLAEPLHHSAHLRLAKERIDFARNYAERFDKQDDCRPGRLPKLAYFSPVPPEKSGIADYSAQILPPFSEHYEVTLISDHCEISDPWLKENIAVRNIAWFKQNHGNFDRIVYHFGNSLLHSHMLPLLRAAPGVVVLHDFYLGSMLAYLELYGNWGPIWTNSLLSSHGYVSIANNGDPDSIRYCIDQFPANFEVISTATGVIVHNEHARRLAGSFYPTYTAETWQVVPLPRLIPPTSRRDEARKELGFSEDDVIVCTFGFLGPTKQNDRLLDAWLSSPLAHKPNCKLVYVGEAHDDPYCHGLKARVQAKGHDRVSISGYVSRETYGLYLDAADIAVQLRTKSRGETSAAVLDCMAHGVPTIVNANGSMAELPDDCVVSLPDDFDVTELSDALLHLAQNRETRCSLGGRAASYTARVHTLVHAAESYRDAIENFYRNSETIHDHNKLIAFARDLQSVDDSNLTAARKLVSSTRFSRPTKQILIDISALRQQDLRTGIQRVVRSVLGAWFKGGEEGQYRIQPVYLDHKDGDWRYIYAHQYSAAFVGRPHADLADSPIDVDEGDIFLGLDHFAHGVTEAARAGLYSEMKRMGASVSFVVYDILPIKMPELFPPISTVIHNAWLEAVASVADQLICISQAVADDVAAWLKENCHSRADSVEVSSWHLGADIGSSAPTRGVPEDGSRILKTIRSHSSFLMVGTIEPRKGYSQVVDAFERLWASGSEEILVIVGTEGWKDVPREAARSLPQLLTRLRNHPELGNRLIWLEKVSDEFLEQIYAAVSALIAASEGEGFGLPLIEAAQHKVPIIVRDIPVFREVAGDHAFYFDGKTDTELAASIRSWIQLRKEDKHPKSDHMPWLSWAESADQLLNAILRPVNNAPSAGAESR